MMDAVILENGNVRVWESGNLLIFTNGKITIEYDLENGLSSFFSGGQKVLAGVFCSAVLSGQPIRSDMPDMKRSPAYNEIKVLQDGFGTGAVVTVACSAEGLPVQKQNYYIYETLDYILMDVSFDSKTELYSNYISPIGVKADITGSCYVSPCKSGDLRVLFIPFDNDKWIRYESNTLDKAKESYEATAVFDKESRKGLIIGSVKHDIWKTGIVIKGTGNRISELTVYGGAASDTTRDTLPHGMVTGRSVKSPQIFLGLFNDYRLGMEEYGRANAIIEPALEWKGGVPVGWNSWACVADKLDAGVYAAASDFLRDALQNSHFYDSEPVYINFDAFWTNLTEQQLAESVKYVHDNGQKAGIYYTPFAFWGRDFDTPVEGTGGKYFYKDIVLRDFNGKVLPDLDGGIPIDPTHPGNLMRVEAALNRLVSLGFEYVKLDFMGHGILEGNFHDHRIKTGVQAYNFGMSHIRNILAPARSGKPFFINLSIAPVFPHQYAHSRRISCDAFGELKDTEYMLNSLTYGWWMNNTIYRFNDPDHTVLYKSTNHPVTTEAEAWSRLNASVIAGTVLLLSDDYRNEKAKLRTGTLLSNESLLDLAKRGRTFVPVEGDTGSEACDLFVLGAQEENRIYLAIFNFKLKATVTKVIKFDRIGLKPENIYRFTDIAGTLSFEAKGKCELKLEPAQSYIFKVEKD